MLSTKWRLLRLLIPLFFTQILVTFTSVYYILFQEIETISIDLFDNKIANYMTISGVPRILKSETFLFMVQYQSDFNILFSVKYSYELLLRGKLTPNRDFKFDFYNAYYVCENNQFNDIDYYYNPLWIYSNRTYSNEKSLPKSIQNDISYIRYLSQLYQSYVDSFWADFQNFYIVEANEPLFVEYPAIKNSSCSRISTTISNLNKREIIAQNIMGMICIILMIQDVEAGIKKQ